jgi:cytochrome bd-type quinol oxidase subunit 1/mono/diheme cytochrome c family protein
MLIAAIATIHVLVSHYAVGGGLFLAIETAFAYRNKDRQYLDYLRRHTQFFVLLTVAFGAITGVGIWWTIGLASPLSTEVLIRTFVFGWATEWVFFLLEILSAFVFYYYWGRLPEKTHVRMGWLYAFSAWMSLVLITGITGFMLNPGAWADPRSGWAQNFWAGFFNPQFLPQVVARTGGALLLTSLYVYLHGSLTIKEGRLHDLIARRSSRPALLGAAMVTLGGLLWFAFLPPSSRAALEAAAVLTVLAVLIFALTIIVFVLLYLGPYRNPQWLSPGFAATLLLFGVAAFSTGEFIREAVRKPYILYNVVLSNQIYPKQVSQLRSEGYLEGGVWTKAYVKQHYPQVMDGNRIDERRLRDLPGSDRQALGAVLFQYHCNDCHALERGYSAVGPMIRGQKKDRLLETVEHLDEGHFFMPPWCGTHEEAEILAEYLESIAPPRPEGMLPSSTAKTTR